SPRQRRAATIRISSDSVTRVSCARSIRSTPIWPRPTSPRSFWAGRSAPCQLRLFLPLAQSVCLGRLPSWCVVIDGRRTGDESPDEAAEDVRELLVRVLVAILRPAEHEGTHAARSVGERNDDDLTDFRCNQMANGIIA